MRVKFDAPTIEALAKEFERFEATCRATSDAQQQRSIVCDTLYLRMEQQFLKGDEKLPFSRGEAYLRLGIPKEFLKT